MRRGSSSPLACAAGAPRRGMMRHHSPRLDPAQVRPAAPLLGPDRPHPQARKREKITQATNGWGRTREERDKIDGDQSFVPVIGWTRDRCTSFVPVGGSNRDKRCMSRLEPPTGIKGGPFFPVGASNRDKRHMSPPLARLAVGPEIKAIFCPGPKNSRDKWPGTKVCSVVVAPETVPCFNISLERW